MALIPETQFPGQIKPGNTNYPLGQPRDVAVSLDGRGTPWNADLCKDIFGFQQGLLAAANITATGDPDTAIESQYVDAINVLIGLQVEALSQIQMSVRIYPEILNEAGVIVVTSPSTGSVRIPAAVEFKHHGAFSVATTEIDFTTEASKTYHIRWSIDNGFSINDLSDLAYNPGSILETDASFDTTYDDMLISRIVTSAANVSSITNLVNKIDLVVVGDSPDISPTTYQDNTSILSMTATPASTALIDINWSRTPVSSFNGASDLQVQYTTGGAQDAEMNIGVRTESRYQLACLYERTNNPTSTKIGYSARA